MFSLRSRGCLLGLLIATSTQADIEPLPFSPFTASYRGEANGISVEKLGTRSLVALGDDKFRLEYQASAMVYSLKETSTFIWHANLPRPLTYEGSRGTFLKKKEDRLRFDWQAGTGTWLHKKKEGRFTLQEGIQDPLTSTLLLAMELDDGKANVRLLEASGKHQDPRDFVLIGTPELSTEMGKIPTYHVKVLHEDDKRHTELWLHHDYPYIPVKVQQDDDGDRFLLELTGFTLQN